jgi:hypothetical protein
MTQQYVLGNTVAFIQRSTLFAHGPFSALVITSVRGRRMGWIGRGVEGLIMLYLEYQSVCPFVRTGSPRPPPESECVPPWNQRAGGNARLRVHEEGTWGANLADFWRESMALCIYILWGGGSYKRFSRTIKLYTSLPSL